MRCRRLTTRTLPNLVVTAYSYDGLDRLTRLKDAKGASVIADNNYTYNDTGNITQEHRSERNARLRV
jgi:YD repeat-containing protein